MNSVTIAFSLNGGCPPEVPLRNHLLLFSKFVLKIDFNCDIMQSFTIAKSLLKTTTKLVEFKALNFVFNRCPRLQLCFLKVIESCSKLENLVLGSFRGDITKRMKWLDNMSPSNIHARIFPDKARYSKFTGDEMMKLFRWDLPKKCNVQIKGIYYRETFSFLWIKSMYAKLEKSGKQDLSIDLERQTYIPLSDFVEETNLPKLSFFRIREKHIISLKLYRYRLNLKLDADSGRQ